MLRNRFAYEIAQFLISHHRIWRLGEIDLVDDTNDRGIDRRSFFAQRLPGRSPFEHNQHLLADAGTDSVNRQQRRSARRVVEIERLHQKQLRALKLSVLLRRDERAYDTC